MIPSNANHVAHVHCSASSFNCRTCDDSWVNLFVHKNKTGSCQMYC